jgi:hypothetical protein
MGYSWAQLSAMSDQDIRDADDRDRAVGPFTPTMMLAELDRRDRACESQLQSSIGISVRLPACVTR